ncbi:MAG: nucleotidyltransferase family protein [Bryobacterales bacterium]|nr:nucleotidyltransferase family protein [Bryobacterales bacterium]
MIAGIILAAGASSRMGSPKALLDYRGETFAGRLVRVLSGACDPVIVALGYHADAIRPVIEGVARMVINPAPERGQLSSLQTALAALPPDADGFAFIPVDSPAVEPATVERLREVFLKRGSATRFVIPRFQGKRGHPVFATRAIAEELLALPATARTSDVVHRYVPATVYVDVDDPGILVDIDDPAAYRQVTESQS